MPDAPLSLTFRRPSWLPPWAVHPFCPPATPVS